MAFFKASLDKISKLVSAFVVITMIVVFGIVFFVQNNANVPSVVTPLSIITFILVVAALLFCFFTRPLGYIIEPDGIVIKMPATSRTLTKANIKSITLIPTGDLRFKVIRTFGNGGYFGYTGWYYNTRYGNMRYYATQLKNYILIETTNNKKIIITSDDSQSFLDRVSKAN